MALKDLRLQYFRSYTDDFFELSPGVNIIVGPNATGKTNLLEAVLLLARGKSYRAKDGELVQFAGGVSTTDAQDSSLVAPDQRWARIDAHIDDGIRTVKLQCSGEICKKSFEIEEKTYLRLSPQKSLPVVLFEPNHLLMLSGSPELRRSYLDDLLEQLKPQFGTARRQYRRVLAQRNALLKQTAKQGVNPFAQLTDATRAQFFVWNLRLSELAGFLVRERLELIANINEVLPTIYGTISSGHTAVSLAYESSLAVDDMTLYESRMIKRFEESLARDIVLGFTTAGPHRDDFKVYLKNHAVQESASRGENRTIVLSLKIIELQFVSKAAQASAETILLLDDVFSELDGSRRHALAEFLQKYQTFITTTDADMAMRRLLNAGAIISTQK
jgi:DNA replication and repair protein RecF